MKRKVYEILIEPIDDPKVHHLDDGTGVRLSFDLIAYIVSFLCCKEATIMATLCQSLKVKIDRVYRHQTPIDLSRLLNGRHLVGYFPAVQNVNPFALVNLSSFYFHKITELSFDGFFDSSLNGVVFPPHLLCLNMGTQFNQSLDTVVFPPKLVTLTMSYQFNQPIDHLVLPTSLKHLTFGYNYNQPVDHLVLPPSLENLTFWFEFNQPVDQLVLPTSLKALFFGFSFNQPVDHLVLPPFLESLTFNGCFNQPVDQLVLPKSLKALVFGKAFNQPIDRLVLPSSLESLKFGFEFNQPVGHLVLPKSLKKLEFGDLFNRYVDELKLPSCLEHFFIGSSFNKPLGRLVLPNSLVNFCLKTDYGFFEAWVGRLCLPESLENLEITLSCAKGEPPLVLPSQLKRALLDVSKTHSGYPWCWPPNLQHLELKGFKSDFFSQPLHFPPSLHTLVFHNEPTPTIPLPPRCEIIVFGNTLGGDHRESIIKLTSRKDFPNSCRKIVVGMPGHSFWKPRAFCVNKYCRIFTVD